MKYFLTLSLFAVAAISSANIVVDGDFSLDTNTYPANGYTSTTSVVGWNFVGNGDAGQEVAPIGIGYLGAANREVDLSGAYDVYVNGMGPGLSQTLNTVVGQMYKISFDYYSGNDYAGGSVAGGVDFYINSSLIGNDLQTSSASNARATYTGTFMGTGSDTIKFLSDHGRISHIGNVSAQAVPEPISLSLFGMGATALLRRRKN
jgi:hypothetical protein